MVGAKVSINGCGGWEANSRQIPAQCSFLQGLFNYT